MNKEQFEAKMQALKEAYEAEQKAQEQASESIAKALEILEALPNNIKKSGNVDTAIRRLKMQLVGKQFTRNRK